MRNKEIVLKKKSKIWKPKNKERAPFLGKIRIITVVILLKGLIKKLEHLR